MIPIATLGFKLLGIGRWLWSAIHAGIKWALSDWRHLVIAAASLFAAFQWLEAGKYERAHGKAVASLERANKTIADMTAASEAARVAQIAMNQAVTAKQTQIERLNRETSILRNAAIRDASRRYADNNRLHKICPRISGADSATKDSVAQGDDGLQADPVVVSERDFNVSNDRTADAIRYEEWARSLVAAGLAVEGE